MQAITGFKIEQVPVYKMVLMATSEPDYEMDRTILVEDYPQHGEYTIVHGGHCSCYGFDDTQWDAAQYTVSELKQLATSWLQNGYGSEHIIAPLILNYLQ